ncbi:immunity 22 family protein [Paenibacillus senegalensis]|uniref:immunity 22 family protein n=1 Tax=Paenibacillus senegalensis TaxID=1465766 RepID=UPI000287D4A7|nr:immunity 22 family protein [Paenibacillus senegalensis]
MRHIITIWGANFSSEEELVAYVESAYDDDGEEVLPSAFLESIGHSSIDRDFLELHFLSNEEEHTAFIQYLKSEYSSHDSFVNLLPPTMDESIRSYNSILLLSGNDSPYGAVNEELFHIVKADLPVDAPALLASIEYWGD